MAKGIAFEQLTARIQSLIEPESRVEWNAKIVDPDSPGDERQIDVLITFPTGRRIAVECRDRTAAQTVMWIEELHGRRASIGVDEIIAVAVNGFTPLAAKKAKRFGISLYDYRSLSDAEIASWVGLIKVHTNLLVIERFEMYVGVTIGPSISPEGGKSEFLYGSEVADAEIFERLRQRAMANNLPDEGVLHYKLDGFTFNGEKPRFVRCSYKVSKRTDITTSEQVINFGMHDTPAGNRSVSVQQTKSPIPEYISRGNRAVVTFDLSDYPLPDNAALLDVVLDCGVPMLPHMFRMSRKGKMTGRMTNNKLGICYFDPSNDEIGDVAGG